MNRHTSYAQNFEDVMLWRALRTVSSGFYVDIGAHSPIVDSVSRMFYENGWRGIHVEPLPKYCKQLQADRPDETVIQAAVAEKSGELLFFEIVDTGISTADPQIASLHRARGFNTIERRVSSITLEKVFDLCETPEIHWLKVDVEGFEPQVLRSWGSSAARPWIVVVESTLPLTQDESFERWESYLTDREYSFVYFDGLNRFYLSKEHLNLRKFFVCGPNVYDGFSLSGQATSPFCLVPVERVQAERDSEMLALTQKCANLSSEVVRLEAEATSLANRLVTSLTEYSKVSEERLKKSDEIFDYFKNSIPEMNKTIERNSIAIEAVLQALNSASFSVANEDK